MADLRDNHGRRYRKLRVSVTDRCQLRCRYCMPDGPAGGAWLPHEDILRYEEIRDFVAILTTVGVADVRVTGGEPLVRRGVPQLVAMLKGLPGVARVSITTNGLLLPTYLDDLVAAGIDTVTVSIDALDPAAYARLSGGADLAPVLRAVAVLAEHPAAIDRKLNAVVVRDVNDAEIPELVRFAAARRMEMRFIEYMPFGSVWGPQALVTVDDMLERLRDAFGELVPVAVPHGSTSLRWRVPALDAHVGIIPTVSRTLCSECDRLRLTADGRVLNCLFDARGASVRDSLRRGDAAAVLQTVTQHLHSKGLGYLAEHRDRLVPAHHMHRVGG